MSEKFPKAIYVHCAAHSLNLAVSAACDIRSIRNCLGIVEKMYCFFNTPKRQDMLLSEIEESDFNPKSKSLKRLCATRWVERYSAIHDFVELYSCVVSALDKISEWKDSTATDANILSKSMDSDFFVSLQVIKVINESKMFFFCSTSIFILLFRSCLDMVCLYVNYYKKLNLI